MSKNTFSALKQQLREAELERDYYKSLVGAFANGMPPEEGACLQHFIFAQWGRKRLEELKGVPTLLRGEVG